MEVVFHEEEAEDSMVYENLHDASAKDAALQSRSGEDSKVPGIKLYRLVIVILGVLCILQATLNISLRLALFNGASCKNLTEERDELRRINFGIEARFKNLTEERDTLKRIIYENCSIQKKGKINNDQRTAKSCESTPTNKTDFVYKVRLEEFNGLFTDIYTMRVLEVIKEGSYDVGLLGKLRTFLSYPHCREALDLGTGKTYLIMGTAKDIHRDDQNQSFQYVLSERTWIEYWPKEAECQMEHRPTCLGIEGMVMQYIFFGCSQ